MKKCIQRKDTEEKPLETADTSKTAQQNQNTLDCLGKLKIKPIAKQFNPYIFKYTEEMQQVCVKLCAQQAHSHSIGNRQKFQIMLQKEQSR